MTEIIAEIANSHQGSPINAEKLALKSLDAGADAVKFQIYFADELLVKNHPYKTSSTSRMAILGKLLTKN